MVGPQMCLLVRLFKGERLYNDLCFVNVNPIVIFFVTH
jgi:hypothetical protein